MDTKNPSTRDGFMWVLNIAGPAIALTLIIKSLYQISRFIINIVNLRRRVRGGGGGGGPLLFLFERAVIGRCLKTTLRDFMFIGPYSFMIGFNKNLAI